MNFDCFGCISYYLKCVFPNPQCFIEIQQITSGRTWEYILRSIEGKHAPSKGLKAFKQGHIHVLMNTMLKFVKPNGLN